MNPLARCPGCMGESKENPCEICGWNSAAQDHSSHHVKPGTLLNGRYTVGKVLGQGGFGITYMGWDNILKVKIAIKEYFPLAIVTRNPESMEISCASAYTLSDFEYGMEKFLDEARILASFSNNPNIVSARDFFKGYGSAYMIMEYIDGIDLKTHLDRQGGRLPWQQVQDIMMRVMDALADVHNEGLLHRDISPDNIFITARGQVKVLDFGAARSALGMQNKSLSVVLKPGYAPPEQYQTRGNQGPWTDVYSIAATMYRCVTGVVPLESLERLEEDGLLPPSAYGVEVPELFDTALMKSLSVKIKDRFQSVQDFQSALLGRDPVAAHQDLHSNFKQADIATVKVPPFAHATPGRAPSREVRTVKMGKKRVAAIAATIFSLLAIGFMALAFLDAKPDTLYAKGQEYLSGSAGERKPEKAAELFEKAAKKGHASSMLNLGNLYESGLGVLKNSQKAAEWYNAAVNEGNVEAKARLGNLYYSGNGVAKDEKKAAELLKDPADKGDVDAQYILGLLHLEGIGVRKDPKLAAKYLQKPSEQGMPGASAKLAQIYLSGTAGQQDSVRGVQLLEQAANKGDVESQYKLGKIYQEGSYNTPKDISKAKDWYGRAETNGHPGATQSLSALNTKQVAAQKQPAVVVAPSSSGKTANNSAPVKKPQPVKNTKPGANSSKQGAVVNNAPPPPPPSNVNNDDDDYEEKERLKRLEYYKLIQSNYDSNKKKK